MRVRIYILGILYFGSVTLAYGHKNSEFMVRVVVFNAIFNNISVTSWRSDLLVEETGIHGENHRSAASH
jgi:hypothetical protein